MPTTSDHEHVLRQVALGVTRPRPAVLSVVSRRAPWRATRHGSGAPTTSSAGGGAMVDVDRAVGSTLCLATDGAGHGIDGIEVISWGRCPGWVEATTSSD